MSTRDHVDDLVSVFERELATVVRTPAYAAVAAGVFFVVVALAWTSRAGSYATLSLDLLTAVEFLVPLAAASFGYRAVLVDTEGPEVDVLRTFSLSRASYLLGVYLGRLVPLTASLAVPLLVASLAVPLLGEGQSSFLATHAVGGSYFLFLRFVSLTVLYAAVALAVVVAASTVATSSRTALALAAVVIVALTVGIDFLVIGGLGAGVIDDTTLAFVLAFSPTSAFRGLVLTLVVGPTSLGAASYGSPVANAIGLLLWTAAALSLGTWRVWTVPHAGNWRAGSPEASAEESDSSHP